MTENEMKKIYELKEEGKGYYAIATLLSLSPSSVKSFLLRHPKSELKIVHHCKNCGAAISQFSDGRIKRFCSLKCHRDYWNKHRKIADRKSTYRLMRKLKTSKTLNLVSLLKLLRVKVKTIKKLTLQ